MTLTQDDILDHIREIRRVRPWQHLMVHGDLTEVQMIERFKRTFEENDDENR